MTVMTHRTPNAGGQMFRTRRVLHTVPPVKVLELFHPRIRDLILSACQHTPTKSPINADGVRIVKAQVKKDRKAEALRQSRGIAHA